LSDYINVTRLCFETTQTGLFDGAKASVNLGTLMDWTNKMQNLALMIRRGWTLILINLKIFENKTIGLGYQPLNLEKSARRIYQDHWQTFTA
jgi:hypothetical protein